MYHSLIISQYTSPTDIQVSQHYHQEPSILNIQRMWLALAPRFIVHQHMIMSGFIWQQNTSNGYTSQTRQNQTRMLYFLYILISILPTFLLWPKLSCRMVAKFRYRYG